MIEYLRICDLALIDTMELEFSSGMNVLTGETGAGKSFIIKALGFLTGDKLAVDMVRPGKEKALVEALFVLPEELGGELILRRELSAETGRSRFFMNGALCSQDAIKDVKQNLLVHVSQHGQQKLLQPAFHIQLLDTAMDKPELLIEKESLLRAIKALLQEQHRLREKAERLAERRDVLEHQQKLIDAVAPEAGEEESLLAQREELRQQGAAQQSIESAFTALHGGEHQLGLFTLLGTLAKAMQTMQPMLGFEQDVSTLQDLQEHLHSMENRLRKQERRIAALDDVEAIEARLFALSQLRRKLQRSMEDIFALRAENEANISFLDICELDCKRLQQQEVGLRRELAALLLILNASREEAAQSLSHKLEAELAGLGFSEQVAVQFIFTEQEILPPVQGSTESIAPALELIPKLLWSPNPGIAPQALDKIASGGELSRFLLAITGLMAKKKNEEAVLIFDEVDAGVGGLTLNSVADRLAYLAEKQQILLITHWPQLAARAKVHFAVHKELCEGVTTTRCHKLQAPEVKEELARMAGGGAQGQLMADQLAG